jgi:hypothetical protein
LVPLTALGEPLPTRTGGEKLQQLYATERFTNDFEVTQA